MNAEFFTCAQCRVTFPKGSPDHGLSGYCCQCEISLGILKIHESDEDNEREMLRTRAVIAQFQLAFPEGISQFEIPTPKGIHTLSIDYGYPIP